MDSAYTGPFPPSDVAFATYQFANDPEYQQGIAGITASGALDGKSEDEKADILLRSEVFYFNHLTGSSLTVEDARLLRQSLSATRSEESQSAASVAPVAIPVPTSDAEEPQMLSFAQLKALIEQGRTDEIPNNKTIPNVLSSAAPSESTVAPPKKPWEVTPAT
ncbi:uncharacterized protein TRAVEDRAFT_31677 [Trametes versicolor FP-101664 SS1]|uniref:uncharacterized protein n=1 Tax=Trametes versicolor (strain FP-101664) TaxID=717944 RepID=UPI0004622CE4|nr:uncharacterized protein TRAVEDRAFT_31677 [Trametes versicolor FP-101664 SS1]EIW53607.1 hypothetical protein TRAVEDRAFT_31677 [Trametes versicolor FP-101664 SS1]